LKAYNDDDRLFCAVFVLLSISIYRFIILVRFFGWSIWSIDLLSRHHHHIQMSRTDNERYDWQDDDLETCLMMSLEESYSHSKEASPRDPGPAQSSIQPSLQPSLPSTLVPQNTLKDGGQKSTDSSQDMDIQGNILRKITEDSEREYLERMILSSVTDFSQFAGIYEYVHICMYIYCIQICI
jgi:hypothetical protein